MREPVAIRRLVKLCDATQQFILGSGKACTSKSQVLTSVRLVLVDHAKPVVRRTARIHKQTPRPHDSHKRFMQFVTISGILGIPLVNLTGCEIRFVFWFLWVSGRVEPYSQRCPKLGTRVSSSKVDKIDTTG
jgi:hypothetical protein